MYNYYILIILAIICSSCAEKNEKLEEKKEDIQMYQMSEMAAFMEVMYQEHQKMKVNILEGKSPDSLAFELTKIHSAQLTDESDNDGQFQQMAQLFVSYEEKIINDPENAVQHYNNAVNLCISCHRSKCTGPIPRIKKLLIK